MGFLSNVKKYLHESAAKGTAERKEERAYQELLRKKLKQARRQAFAKERIKIERALAKQSARKKVQSLSSSAFFGQSPTQGTNDAVKRQRELEKKLFG